MPEAADPDFVDRPAYTYLELDDELDATADPQRVARGIRNGLLLVAGFWLVLFVLLLIAFRT